MQATNIADIDFNVNTFLLVDCIKEVTNKDYQKIILIELLGIVYNDNIITTTEKEMIDIIVDTWNVNKPCSSLW